MTVIETKDLVKTYHTKVKAEGLKGSFKALFKPEYMDVEAVKNISMQVNKGEIVAFIGPNGAGKSTFIKMLSGILHPTSGEISVLGLSPVRERQKLAMKIGTVFGQKSQLWLHLPAVDSFTLLAAIYEISDKEKKQRVEELSELFELGEFLNVPVRKLSLGQRIRCEIAASLLHNPELLFLDEPTIGLDVVAKQAVRELIQERNRAEGTTVFLTSHDPADIEYLAKRTIVIDRGKIALDSTVEQLKNEYITERIVEIKFSKPQPNFVIEGLDTTIDEGGLVAKLTVDRDINEVMRRIVGLADIADITVSHPPMEDIIATIFRQQGKMT